MKHILMTNNITRDDNLKVANFLKSNPILTNNKKVREFEYQWNKWLGNGIVYLSILAPAIYFQYLT